MVSYLLRGYSFGLNAKAHQAKRQGLLCISIFTEAELLFGLERKPEAVRLRSLVADFLTKTSVFAFGREDVPFYAQIRAVTEQTGATIASLDLLIAAHALAVDATLITADKIFAQVPGLRTENWAEDLR